MQEISRVILTNFTDETIMISFMFLTIVFSILVAYWLFNRRKYRELTHQIPASVVKNYLDSIIQNSTALKSSLFRGGGLEVGDGIPSVVPVRDFPSMNVEVSGVSQAELSQKNAEIASLHSRLGDKDRIVSDLEKKLSELRGQLASASGADQDVVASLQAELDAAHKRIAELEALLAKAQAAGSSNPLAEKQLAEVSKERDELKERLAEYEIIEDDIANLKKYKQENEQLRKSLAAYEGGAAPVAAAPVAAPVAAAPVAAEIAEEPVIEEEVSIPEPEAPAAEFEDDLEAQMAAAIAESAPAAAPVPEAEAPTPAPAPAKAAAPSEVALPDEGNAEQRSAEELLSEFEKMLG